MKRNLLKAIIVLACLILIIPCLMTSSFASGENSVYYCRESLKSLPDSDKLVYAYDKIVEGVAVSSTDITVYNGSDSLSVDELRTVYDAYRRDHAEHFWLGNSYTYSYTSETVTSIKPTYILSGDELSAAKIEFENAIDNIIAGVNSSMTEYEKEKYLHDALAIQVTYIESENAHNAYGALVEGKAVCEGYAEALQCLLHRVGIQSFIAIGSSINPSTSTSEGHAWNSVKIDGKYYHLDLTWNDQGSKLFYAYFNVSDEIIKKDHVIDEAPFPLPECNSLDSFYFKKEGGLLETYTVDSVGQLLKSNSLTASFYIPDGTDEFIVWFKSNVSKIAEKAGVTSTFTYAYSKIGDEVIIYINTCFHTNVSAVAKKSSSCTENGNIAHYKCESCGKLFEDASAKKEILNVNSVIIPAGHSFTDTSEEISRLKYEPVDCKSHYQYYYGCSKCGEICTDKYFESDRVGPHSAVFVQGYDATCSKEGQKSYYSCSCGRYFEDHGAKKEITDIKNYATLPKTAHGKTDALGRCTVCGELAEITDGIMKIGIIVGCALIGLPIVIMILKKLFKKKKQ